MKEYVLYRGDGVNYQTILQIISKRYSEILSSNLVGIYIHARIEILKNPVYIVLNLCRVNSYIKDKLILSKEQGGKWGLNNLPKQYYDIIAKALHCYKTRESMVIVEKEAISFCDYMLDLIF
jgi:streptomycin 3"-adenylyltransferase